MILSISMGFLSLLLVAAVFGPFFLAAYAGRSTHRKMSRYVRQAVKDMNLDLSRQEQWSNKLIGLDPLHRVLVFALRSPEGSISIQYWDLTHLTDCEIHNETHTHRLNGRKVSALNRLDLELWFGAGQDKVRLELYSRADAFGEDLEQNRAERWRQFILPFVAAKKPQSALA